MGDFLKCKGESKGMNIVVGNDELGFFTGGVERFRLLDGCFREYLGTLQIIGFEADPVVIDCVGS